MQAALAESNFYPDNDAIELRQKLAEYHNVQPEQIVPTAGSTALLGIIARTLLSTGAQRGHQRAIVHRVSRLLRRRREDNSSRFRCEATGLI